jgi:YtkA-like
VALTRDVLLRNDAWLPHSAKDQTMTTNRLAVATLGLAIIFGASSGYAGPKDYEFQPVSAEVKNGHGSDVAVRLVDKRTGKPVEGAVIFRTRLDMSPDSMGEMTAKHAAAPSNEPGVYRFKADISMAGGWALKLQAKVPGESDTVEGTVVFKAK